MTTEKIRLRTQINKMESEKTIIVLENTTN